MLKFLSMQAALNTAVSADWLEAQPPFMLAAAQECSEAIDHYGWKWWATQVKNLPAFRMEVVDVWHFLLSQILVDFKGDADSAADYLAQRIYSPTFVKLGHGIYIEIDALPSPIERLQKLRALADMGQTNFYLFGKVMEDAQMNWELMEQMYICKNAINYVRRANGYKDGTYKKEWEPGLEDNDVAMRMLGVSGSVDLSDFKMQLQNHYDRNVKEFQRDH